MTLPYKDEITLWHAAEDLMALRKFQANPPAFLLVSAKRKAAR